MKYLPIDIDYVIKLVNEILGAKFRVESNSVVLLPNKDVINCSLQSIREPFPMEDVQSEIMQLTLYAYMNVHNAKIKSANEQDLSKLLGLHKGSFVSISDDSQVYDFNMYFKDCHPIGEPQADTGFRYCMYVMNGSILITQKGGGLLVNDISYNLFDENKKNKTTLALMSYEETPILTNHQMIDIRRNKISTHILTNTYTFAAFGLFLNDIVHSKLLKSLTEGNAFSGSMPTFILQKIKHTTKGTEILLEKEVRIVDGNIKGHAGDFINYQLIFQEI